MTLCAAEDGDCQVPVKAPEHVATTTPKLASELVAVFSHHRPSDTPPPASFSCDNGRRRKLLRVVL